MQSHALCTGRPAAWGARTLTPPSRRWQGRTLPRLVQASSMASQDVEAVAAAAGGTRVSPLSSCLELLNNAQPFSMKSLDQAGDELEAYCSMLSDDESANTCWDAYEYLESKRSEAEAGCAVELMETGQPGQFCARLQALERLTYELIGSGEVSNIVSALATLSRAEKRAAEKAAAVHHGDAVAFLDEDDMAVAHTQSDQEIESTMPSRRDYLHSLFMHVDRNHDGRMDMEEFRAAMRALGDELDGRTVALIGEAMDLHGHLDEDQFIQVVEAEDMSSHDRLTKMWRSRWEQRHYRDHHNKWGSSPFDVA